MQTQHTFKLGAVRSTALVLAGLTAVALLASSGPAIAQTRYTITDLGTPPGVANSYLWQQAVNNLGHVAVYGNNTDNPNAFEKDVSFLWKGPGKVVPLPGLPGATDTIAFNLNDRDQVVGQSGPVGLSSTMHAVLWDGGRVLDLGTLPGDTDSQAYQINNEGIVVGASFNADHSLITAVYWRNGKIFPLAARNNGSLSIAQGINDRRQIVGYSGPEFDHVHAVIWENGNLTDLGTLGGDASLAIAINNRGQIAGLSQVPGGDWHAALWQNNVITDLGNFGADPFGLALSINSRGQIVGFSAQDLTDMATGHALLWENGIMVDLQTRIPAGSGWVLRAATSINDRGQIGAIGVHNGKTRALLLTPTQRGN